MKKILVMFIVVAVFTLVAILGRTSGWNDDVMTSGCLSLAMLVSCMWLLCSLVEKGKPVNAGLILRKGQLVEICSTNVDVDVGNHSPVILRVFPFNSGSRRFVRFESDQSPEGDVLIEGYRYVWDGKKLVSIKD